MKKARKENWGILILLIAMATLMTAGCGGGGTNSEPAACVKNPLLCYQMETTTVSGRVYVPLGLSLSETPRKTGLLERIAGIFGAQKVVALTNKQVLPGATVRAGYLDEDGDFIPNLSTSVTTDSNGYYTLPYVEPGNNIVIRATYTTASNITINVYNIMSISSSYIGYEYPSSTTTVDSTVETTLAVAAVSKIIQDYNDNSASVTNISGEDVDTDRVDDIVDLINDNLQAQYSLGNVNVNNVVTSSLSAETELGKLMDEVDTLKVVVSQLSAPTSGDPYVVAFLPADGTTGVEYDGTTFSVVFSERMNSSITPEGFSITLRNSTTGSYLTISDLNATSYGYFQWDNAAANGDSAYTNDMLNYVLRSNATLKSNGLSTLTPGTTYSITAITVPTNLKDYGGASLKTSTGIPTSNYGSFTTKN